MLQVAPPARILDVTCGAAGHAIALAQSGFSVYGVDLSADMLALARTRSVGLALTLEQADLNLWSPPATPFDAAYWLGNGFPYFPHEATLAILARLATALRPGAHLLVDISSCAECLLPNLDASASYPTPDLTLEIRNTYHPTLGCLESRMAFVSLHHTESRTALHYVRTIAEILRLFTASGFALAALTTNDGHTPFALGHPTAWLRVQRQ
ncbi:MAG: class I SAM-dependent methyltransferase [Bryobacter sp.]|nr:class I SAM-dependent methyltransferase [Bryobacter sp.]